MDLPIQITAKNLDMTDAIEAAVRKRAEKLRKFSKEIISCRVVVECPHRHHHKGVMYSVHVDLGVRGKELVVTREQNADLYVAIKEAFDALRRQLIGYDDRRHNQVKHHETLA